MVPAKHMISWHLLKQQNLHSHDTAWGTGRVLESSPFQMSITNILIFQGTPDIWGQENLLVLQHWAGEAQKYKLEVIQAQKYKLEVI